MSGAMDDETFRALMVPATSIPEHLRKNAKVAGRAGRPRIYASAAERQAAYRNRKKQVTAT